MQSRTLIDVPVLATPRTVLVTGGSGGIGRAVAARLAAMGSRVAVGYNSRGDAAAAVVSVPDPVYTEVGVAFVVGSAAAEELDAHCREHLARYKVPKRIELLPGLPLLSAGKVDKAALKEEARRLSEEAPGCSAAPSS